MVGKKYLVILDGKAEGCDYTLGCNVRYEIFNSKEEVYEWIKDFKEEAEEVDEPYDYYIDEMGLSEIRIFTIEPEEDWDLEIERKDIKKEREQTEYKRKEREEMKKYRELEKKYGGGEKR